MQTISKYISDVEKGYPVTRFAENIPKVQSKIVSWKTERNGSVGISLAAPGHQHAHGDSLIAIQEKLISVFTDKSFKVLVPSNALTVSIALINFTVGKSVQEFVPISKNMPEGSFFSYQKLSKHVQATYYNEDGVQYLAGLAYYVQLRDSFLLTTDIDSVVMTTAIRSSTAYPVGDRWKSWRFTKFGDYGRDCKTAGKRVSVHCDEGKDPVHCFYNFNTRKWEYKNCAECREEAKTYKFVSKKTVEVKKINEKMEEKPVSTPTKVVEKLEKLTVKEAGDSDCDDFEFVN